MEAINLTDALLTSGMSNGSGGGSERPSDGQAMSSLPLYLLVWVSVSYAIIFLVGVLGNILVLAVIWANKDMRKSTDLIMANLSTADLLVLLICMSAAMTEFYGREEWLFGNAGCKLIPFLENLSVHASSLSIVTISIERYFAICHPLQVKARFTPRRSVIMIVIIWLAAVLATIPFFVIAKEKDERYPDGKPVKVCSTAIIEKWKKGYVVTLTCLFFALPVVILLVIYVLICRVLVAERTIFHSTGNSRNSNSTASTVRNRHQVVYVLLAITVAFFACLLPFRVYSLWLLFESHDVIRTISSESFMNIVSFCRVMFYLNSAINPVLYNLFSTKFRKAFERTICRGQTKIRKGPSAHTSVYQMDEQSSAKRRCNRNSCPFSKCQGGGHQVADAFIPADHEGGNGEQSPHVDIDHIGPEQPMVSLDEVNGVRYPYPEYV